MSTRADTTGRRADTTVVTADGAAPPVVVGADGVTVEIEWAAGVWSDVTSRVQFEDDLVITRGRQGLWDDGQPGTLAFSLDNLDGAGTPDNPASPWPRAGDAVRVRVTVTHSGTAWVRFLGRVDSWEPTFPEDGTPTVAVTATDPMAGLSSLRSPSLLQQAAANAWQFMAGWSVIELPQPASQGPAVVLDRNPASPGAVTLIDQGRPGVVELADPGPLGWVGGWSLSTRDTTSARRGNAVWVDIPTSARLAGGMWFATERVITDTTVDTLLMVLGVDGSVLWQLTIGSDGVDTLLQLRQGGDQYDIGSIRGTTTGFNTGAWHSISWEYRATLGTVRVLVDGVTLGSVTCSATAQTAAVYGGRALSRSATRIEHVFTGSIGGLWWAGGLDFVGSRPAVDVPTKVAGGTTAPWATVAREIARSAGGPVRSVSAVGADSRAVLRVTGGDRSVLEHLLTIARSVGGTVWYDPATDAVKMSGPDSARPTVVEATVTAAEDDAGAMVWARGIDDQPTQVTASSDGVGSVVVTSTDVAAGVIREASIDTVAPTLADLYDVAYLNLNRARRLRATRVAVDLTTAVADLWAAVMGLRSGSRVRVDGLPTQWFGTSWRDLLVAGWTETYTGPGHVVVELATDAADDPIEGVWDDDTLGRWGSDGDLTTASSSTSSATTVTVTAAGALALSTDSADYPLDLSYGGERVTVTTAPAAPSSGVQTLTVTRGVAPTPARAHSAGEVVEVWAAPAWAL